MWEEKLGSSHALTVRTGGVKGRVTGRFLSQVLAVQVYLGCETH